MIPESMRLSIQPTSTAIYEAGDRLGKSYLRVCRCDDCKLMGHYIDIHEGGPCPNCGSKNVKEYVGKFIPVPVPCRVRTFLGISFKTAIKYDTNVGYWEIIK